MPPLQSPQMTTRLRLSDGRAVSVSIPLRDAAVLDPLVTWASRRTRYTYLAEAAVVVSTLVVSSIVDSLWLSLAWALVAGPYVLSLSDGASRELVVERWASTTLKRQGIW